MKKIWRPLASLALSAVALAGIAVLAADPDRVAPNLRAKRAARFSWRAFLWRLYEAIGQDRVLALAGGIVFFGLLALFPAISAFVSSYALFADLSTIAGHLDLINGTMPPAALEIIRTQVVRIVTAGPGGLSLAFVVSFAIALWSANAGLKSMIDALNIVFHVQETRSFIRLNLVSLTMTVGAIVVALAAVGGVVVFPLVLAYFGWTMSETFSSLLRWPLLLLLVLAGLAVIYRYGPDRPFARFRLVTPGALFAVVAWMVGSLALSWYLSNFANYDATYGSLGAAIGLMMWLWMTSIVVLVGAEIDFALVEMADGAAAPGRARLPLANK